MIQKIAGKKYILVALPQKTDVVVDFDAKAKGVYMEKSGANQRLVIPAPVGEASLIRAERLIRKAIRTATGYGYTKIALELEQLRQLGLPKDDTRAGQCIAENIALADWDFRRQKKAPEGGWVDITHVSLVGKASKELLRGIERGRTIAGSVNFARDISAATADEMTPGELVKQAQKALRGLPVRVTVLGMSQLKKLGAGGIVAVGKGSQHEPKLLVMEYGYTRKEKPRVLIGKGVTFDSGGYSLKPSAAMLEMHMDMTGAATVIASMQAIARLKIARHVVAIAPIVENMVSGNAFRPGDILRMMNGMTVDVQNTDAEGRLILADAITYSKRYSPESIITVATLTGAALSALGQRATALLTQNDSFSKTIMEASMQVGDRVWPLPLWNDYLVDIRSKFADIANAEQTRWGGTITAAIFLQQFANDIKAPFAHLDIAPRMESIEEDQLSSGATGEPTRLLIELISKQL